MVFDDDDVGAMHTASGGAKQQRIKKKEPPKYPLGRWVIIYEGTEFETWVRTEEILPNGRVGCIVRGGQKLIVPRAVLPEPVTRRRPRR